MNDIEENFYKTFGIEKNIIPDTCSNRWFDCYREGDYCCKKFDKKTIKEIV